MIKNAFGRSGASRHCGLEPLPRFRRKFLEFLRCDRFFRLSDSSLDKLSILWCGYRTSMKPDWLTECFTRDLSPTRLDIEGKEFVPLKPFQHSKLPRRIDRTRTQNRLIISIELKARLISRMNLPAAR